MLGSISIPEGDTLQVVCVVDGSTDGTLEMLARDFPAVHVVKGPGNWWYTRSMNEGFTYAVENLSPDLVLSLNDDIEIRPDYLTSLVQAYQQMGRDGLMGSISLSVETPHTVTFSGTRSEGKFPYRWKPYIPMGLVDPKKLTGVYPTKELPGRGILVSAKVLQMLNFFDERFPQYHSDFDFCLRAAGKGIPVYVSYDSVVYSHVMQTSNSTTFKKISTSGFLKNLINPYSRKHIGQNAYYIWRHKPKLLFPFFYTTWFLLLFVNHVKVNVFNKRSYGA